MTLAYCPNGRVLLPPNFARVWANFIQEFLSFTHAKLQSMVDLIDYPHVPAINSLDIKQDRWVLLRNADHAVLRDMTFSVKEARYVLWRWWFHTTIVPQISRTVKLRRKPSMRLDGSQPSGRRSTLHMAGSTLTANDLPLSGENRASRVDAAEYATHHESTCGATRSEFVSNAFPYDRHVRLSLKFGVPVGCSMLRGTMRQHHRRVRDVTSRGVVGDRYGFNLLRLSLARCCKVRSGVERFAVLLRLPRRSNERDLRIVQVPRCAHHVTREVASKQRTNERFTNLLTVGTTSQLLGQCVRRHNVCHMCITSFHARTVSRITQRMGRNASRNIRLTQHISMHHVAYADNTHHVCSIDNAYNRQEPPPPPAVPALSAWKTGPHSWTTSSKILSYVSALVSYPCPKGA